LSRTTADVGISDRESDAVMKRLAIAVLVIVVMCFGALLWY